MHWVFVAADGLSLIVAGGGRSLVEVCGLLFMKEERNRPN